MADHPLTRRQEDALLAATSNPPKPGRRHMRALARVGYAVRTRQVTRYGLRLVTVITGSGWAEAQRIRDRRQN